MVRVAIVLSRTPEIRKEALLQKKAERLPTVVPEASGQRREGVVVRSVTV